MTEHNIHTLLTRIAEGVLSPDDALSQLQGMPQAEDISALLQGIDLDTMRRPRTGLGEVVMGTGKSIDQILACVAGLAQNGESVLATRVDAEAGNALAQAHPDGSYHATARLFALGVDLALDAPRADTADIMVVTAGTSDMPVALEAVGAARFFGLDCSLAADVGVAGVHRLAKHLPALRAAKLIIAVAGMDGALPSVLAGLVPTPIVAVPSSQDSGNPMGGLSAMLAMLNSCSPGITVCNIDNGFGAAAFAAKLLLDKDMD